jgi:hypothetical protein
MIFSDLASPAEAENEDASGLHGFAQAGPASILGSSPRTGFFGIMHWALFGFAKSLFFAKKPARRRAFSSLWRSRALFAAS